MSTTVIQASGVKSRHHSLRRRTDGAILREGLITVTIATGLATIAFLQLDRGFLGFSESINNPLRMLLGWYMVAPQLIPPVSLLCCYWMLGCYLMGLKRFSELRELDSQEAAAPIVSPSNTIPSNHYYSL